MPEKINESENTALHEAVRYNHIDVVNKLIEADTEVSYGANISGETPLYLAAERGYTEVVNKILNKCKSTAGGPMGRTALHAAVIRRDIAMAKRLLEMSNQKDEQGRFALHYAAFLGYDEIVEMLLDKYPSAAYQADNDGMTALLLAAGNGQAKAVNKLLEKCPNCCELVDERGRNALHLALTSADDSTIQIFLKDPALGNLINQKDNDGNTPLLQLANSGSDISTFIDHDKVDELVFNKKNKNVVDIMPAKDLIRGYRKKKMFSQSLKRAKKCRRIIVPKQEVSKRKVNQPSTIRIGKVNHVKVEDEGSEDINKPKEAGSEDIIEMTNGPQETHLLVATLVAMVTFAAGFTLPGGYIGEGNPNEGTALLVRSAAFQAFVILDALAFFFSCSAVVIHLTMGQQNGERELVILFTKKLVLLSYAMIAMVFAFITGTYAVLYPHKTLAITVCIIGCTNGAFICFFASIKTPFELVILENLSFLKKRLKQNLRKDT